MNTQVQPLVADPGSTSWEEVAAEQQRMTKKKQPDLTAVLSPKDSQGVWFAFLALYGIRPGASEHAVVESNEHFTVIQTPRGNLALPTKYLKIKSKNKQKREALYRLQNALKEATKMGVLDDLAPDMAYGPDGVNDFCEVVGKALTIEPRLKIDSPSPANKSSLIHWVQLNENEFVGGDEGHYRVVCEGIRGGCWVPYYRDEELPVPHAHFVDQNLAKSVCGDHLLLQALRNGS